ncbi:MAG TPA: helix-turn-helix transcriptional regulator [Actinophytocola sp.]|uniref:helix-turn-helix transcriptional regulator n=1 Tax=Actinophytocola sp. TaxID=1872138 RepID=UPI002DDD2407|nr:helix-turn-helix transcriptional regulator [Actinophytocola sp.]HEV2782915.1 helix-turn-helix transcriptional regulator [Actinophytocola sp.]
MWTTPAASTALSSRDLAAILRTYRGINRLSQEQLADLLGYDKTYISMIETRRRTIGDIATRRHIARTLGLPVHLLGVTDGTGDAGFTAMLQFGDSTIRLAEVARKAGCAVDAVNELWPLVARLETRAAEGLLERDALILLGQGRAALGVSLGTVLPEERLATAARWTGKAVRVAERLGDHAFLGHALRMHGNELRKANHPAAALARLTHAAALANDREGVGTSYALLARAAGDHGYPDLFDHALDCCRKLMDGGVAHGMLFNPFAFREIWLRGLMSTGRATAAVRIIQTDDSDWRPVAPQWRVIERVTTGEVLLTAGQRDAAEDALRTALSSAERHRLPHQIQRGIRAAAAGGLTDIRDAGRAALQRLNNLLTAGGPQPETP